MIPRRIFMSGLGAVAGSTVIWPLAARAQQRERMRRIGVHMNLAENDPEARMYIDAFVGRLGELGWSVGRNLRVDYRWTQGTAARIRSTAAELIELKPDVILTVGGSHVGPLQELAGDLPIVFVQVSDPIGGGFVDSLSAPGRNATGFTVFDYSISGKWLELLKEIAPGVKRVALLRDAANPSGTGLFGSLQSTAPSLGVDAVPIGLRDAGEIERGVMAFARTANGGLIVAPNTLALFQRKLIVALAQKNHLPAVYPFGYYVSDGGLCAYGPDPVDQYRRAAGYVDRILKGQKPADLPVQNPVKFNLAINLKTAKALGLTIPQTLLVAADEVIE
jgi:putative tryptophan/tyrosine transport system substrate-binding protein